MLRTTSRSYSGSWTRPHCSLVTRIMQQITPSITVCLLCLAKYEHDLLSAADADRRGYRSQAASGKSTVDAIAVDSLSAVVEDDDAVSGRERPRSTEESSDSNNACALFRSLSFLALRDTHHIVIWEKDRNLTRVIVLQTG